MNLLHDYGLYFLIGQYPHGPLGGLARTLVLSSLALVLAFPLGVLLGVGLASPWRVLRWPLLGLAYVVRATPLLMIVFWVYFLLPLYTGGSPNQFQTMLMSLVAFEGVYIGVIVAAGIRALPHGQVEAARALGLSHMAAMAGVVMPQVVRNMLPSLVGEFVAIIKLTSLGYLVGLSEVTFVAEQINAQTITHAAEVYAWLAGSYFLMCFGISRLAYGLERKLSLGGVRQHP